MKRLHEISVQFEDISAKLKFNKLHREYQWHKMRYDRGVYGSAVTPEKLIGIRLHCRLLYAELKNIDPVRTLKEVVPLKITV